MDIVEGHIRIYAAILASQPLIYSVVFLGEEKRRAIARAHEKMRLALLIGPILPLMTVALMYGGFWLGLQFGRVHQFIFSLVGAFAGFGLGSFLVWKILMRLTK